MVFKCLGSSHMQRRLSLWPLLFRTQAVPEMEEGAVNTTQTNIVI